MPPWEVDVAHIGGPCTLPSQLPKQVVADTSEGVWNLTPSNGIQGRWVDGEARPRGERMRTKQKEETVSTSRHKNTARKLPRGSSGGFSGEEKMKQRAKRRVCRMGRSG